MEVIEAVTEMFTILPSSPSHHMRLVSALCERHAIGLIAATW